MTPAPTATPSVNLKQLDSLHADFVQMFQVYGRMSLDGALCRRIAFNVQTAMDDDRIDVDVVFQTLMQYEGRLLDGRWTDLLARQLVARQTELRVGVLSLFEHPVRNEWVPMEIYEVRPCDWRGQPIGQALTLYCLAGHPAGHRLVKRIPEKFLGFLAYRIGFTRKLVYDQEPRQLIGLRLWGWLVESEREELEFAEWAVDDAMTKWNRAILKKRGRFDVELDRLRESEVANYSCEFDEECYCLDCRRRVHHCVAVPNRERYYGPELDESPAHDHEPDRGEESPGDPVAIA